MSKEKAILLIFCLVLFLSCKNNREISSDITSVADLKLTYELNENPNSEIKDVVNKIELIPLETNKEILVDKFFNRQYALYIPDKYFAIIDMGVNLFLFDTKGKHISNSKGCHGDGPGQFFAPHYFAYNQFNNTFQLIDVYSQMFEYDMNFNFKRKTKLNLTHLRPIVSFSIIDSSTIACTIPNNEAEQSMYIYSLIENKVIKEIQYPGKIETTSMNTGVVTKVKEEFIFIPMDMNNNVFQFHPDEKNISLKYTIDNGKNGISVDDLRTKNINEKDVLPALIELNKFNPFQKYVSSDYIASIYMKNNKFYHHFFNLKTKKQMMTSLSTKNKPYIPVGFHLDSSTYYAVVYAHDINNHIDTDLLLDKSVLDKISDDDNPVIIKYHLKV